MARRRRWLSCIDPDPADAVDAPLAVLCIVLASCLMVLLFALCLDVEWAYGTIGRLGLCSSRHQGG